MKLSPETSNNKDENLSDVIDSLKSDITKKDNQINLLLEQIQILKAARFGKKTEKYSEDQLGLFDEAEVESSEKEPEDELETVTITRKKKPARKPLPKSLPYIEKIHDLADDEKQCSCGCELTHIGDERSEQLDVVPQLTYRIINIKKKYACKNTKCLDTIKTTPAPKQPIPKSIASPGLLASVITSKFNYHMPLYRQEDMYNRANIDITRGTLSEWVIKSAALLSPIVKLLHDNILNYDISYADETKLRVLNQNKQKTEKLAYMWLFGGGKPGEECFVYQYHSGRSHQIAYDFFEDYKGYIHADCYAAYINLGLLPLIIHIACMAHARRYFMDVVKSTKNGNGLAKQAIKWFRKLYDIEKKLKEDEASTNQIYKKRQSESAKILAEFKVWLDDNQEKVPPKSAIGKAFAYSIKHWDSLIKYIDDGRLEIDNNRSERAIKPFVIGRKNWLFHYNDLGAEAGATLYSLIETCKAHNVDVFSYFKYALTEIVHCKTVEDLEKLLPFNCPKDKLEDQRAIPYLTYPE